jgi:hypothetical protein
MNSSAGEKLLMPRLIFYVYDIKSTMGLLKVNDPGRAVTLVFACASVMFGQYPSGTYQIPGVSRGSQQERSEPRYQTPPNQRQTESPLSISGKWRSFVDETANPLTLGAAFFNGGLAHITKTDPKYGTDSKAFASQFGASFADIATQNFFGDFVLASAFHEDPRYSRRGPPYRFWSRFGYAVSRSVIIRTDSGGESFNWSNVLGSAMSAGLSNAYYPPASRSGRATVLHFALATVGAGLGNLAPEFWPDFKKKVFGRHDERFR